MKRILLCWVAALLGLAGFDNAARAADMPLKAPPPPPVFTWTGVYVGAQGGWGRENSYSEATATFFCAAGGACAAAVPIAPPLAIANMSTSGGFGGGTAGVNYQFNTPYFYTPVVIGLEGDWSAADIDGRNACNTGFTVVAFGAGFTGTCTTNLREFGTLTGRAGLAWDRALFYVKGGGAWGWFNEQVATASAAGVTGPAANFNTDRWGWTIGGGVEYAFWSGWSAKVEYQHMDFGAVNTVFPFVNVPPFAPGIFNVVARDSQRVDIVRAGVNYRFNWWGAPY
jgi:outer membrane immunogenic protein